MGELVAAAAERHLRDRRDRDGKDLFWRPDAAERAIGFYPAVLTVTAGAKAGHPFVLLDWQMFCAGSLFGWHLSSGRLRFRHGWLETGKGQAKSPFMAATGLYCVGFRDVQRAEGYAIAWDRDQANVPFKDAVAMCRAPIPGQEDEPEELRDTLESRGTVVIRGTLDNAWKIEVPHTSSKFQSLANGENISGPRPCFVLADEIHEFKSGEPIETWRRAIAKMPGDALMLQGTNTPSITQHVGTSYSEFYQQIAKGQHKDDEAFAFVARVDKADQETVFENEAVWRKALPALGVTFPIENIRGEVNTARVLLSTAQSVKRLYFGIPTGTDGFWIAEDAWTSCLGPVDDRAMRGRRCWLSLDLSKKNDLTALTAVWVGGDDHLYAKTWYWTTKSGIADRSRAENTSYDLWAADPTVNLVAVTGAVIDKTFVAEQVKAICAEHEVEFLAFDPAGMGDFIEACGDIGFDVWRWRGPDEPEGVGLKLVSHAQGKRVVFEDRQLCMPRSVERFEDAILEAKITIDDDPVTTMCAANAILDADPQGNRCFDKKRSRGRIDGIVTIAMAVGAATMTETATPMNIDDFLAHAVVV